MSRKPVPTLDHAIHEARRIRRNLVRMRKEIDLGGDCAFASLLLAEALGGPQSLRMTASSYMMHVWNVVEGTIIDITATQFNDYEASEPEVFGVLVTKQPRSYHRPVALWGRRAVRHITEDMLSDHDALCQLVVRRGVIDRLLTRCGT